MLTKYKNDIYEILRALNYNIDFFEINESKFSNNEEFTKIQIKNTPLFFRFRRTSHNHHKFQFDYTSYSPNYQLSGCFPLNGFFQFDQVKNEFKIWLIEKIKDYWDEKYAINLWNNDFKLIPYLSNISEDHNNISFSTNEKDFIKIKLIDFQNQIISEFNFINEKLELIEFKIEYLIQSLNKQQKMDWKSLAIGTIINLIMNLTVDTDVGNKIWQLFLYTFADVKLLLIN